MKRLDLRDLRGDKSLREVAEYLGITPQMLGKIELKRRSPSLRVAKKIADHYGVLVEQIFFNDQRDEMSQTNGERDSTTKPFPAA